MTKNKQPISIFAPLVKYRHQLMLIGIIALAVFFRFWKLNTLPPGLHPDEAANGLDIVLRMFKGDIRPLYATNGPRESLFFLLQAIFVAIMGNTVTALRVAPALCGVAGVFTTYLWMKSWYGQRAGLIAGFLMAVTPWGVIITRDGFRASMTPLMVTLTLWLYTRALQTGKKKWFAFAGLSMGAGLYTYLSFRLFPFGLLAIAGCLYLGRRDFYKKWRKSINYSLIFVAIALIPMGLYGIKHPGDLGARAGGVSFTNKELNHGKPLQTLFDTGIKTLLMFNVHGDENYRQNLGGEPALNVFVGIMFVLGILICLSTITEPRSYGMMLLWAVMLAPEVLTAEGIPHFLRSIGALPFTLALATIGIGYMLDRWYATFPINSAARGTGLAIMLFLLALTAYHGYTEYFVAWASAPQTFEAYSEDSVGIAKYMISHPFTGQRIVLIDGYSDKTVQYLTHNKVTYRRIDPSEISGIPADGQPKQFLISKSFKDESLRDFRAKFSGGLLTPQYSQYNFTNAELFLVYTVTK